MIRYPFSLFTKYGLSHDVVLALIGRVGQFILMFISMRLMTQILSPREVGLATLITTTTAFFALCFVNPVGMYFNRRLHSWVISDSARQKFQWYMVYVIAVSTLSAFLIFIMYTINIINIDVSILWFVLFIVASLLFNTAVQTIIPAFNLLGRIKPFVVFNLGVISMGLVFSIISTKLFQPTAEYWLSGIIIAQVLVAPFAYRVFFGPTHSIVSKLERPKIQTISFVFAFSWPITISVLLQWAQMQGYRFFLDVSFGLEELGMYAAGYGIAASLTSAAETVFATWFQPRFYKAVNSTNVSERENAWNNYSKAMVPGALLALTALLAAAPSLPRIMLGPAFHDTVLYVMLGAMAEWTRVMVGIVSLEAHQRMSTIRLILPYASGAIVTYFTLFTLIELVGIYSAPIAVFLGGLVITTYLHRLTQKEVGNNTTYAMKFKQLYYHQNLFILILTTVMILIIQKMWLDLSNPIIAWGNCLIILCIWTVFALRHYYPILKKRG